MKITCIKEPGGIFRPASDLEHDKTTKFKSNNYYDVEVKLSRNPSFHGKVFQFFNFCFEHWKCDREFLNEAGQFDVFRKNLTCLAGYYDEFYNMKGEVRIESKSLSFGSMTQEEFEKCYLALTNAAMKHIFLGCDDNTYNQLLGFF